MSFLDHITQSIKDLSKQIQGVQEILTEQMQQQNRLLQEIATRLQPVIADPNNLSESHALYVQRVRMATESSNNLKVAFKQNDQAKKMANQKEMQEEENFVLSIDSLDFFSTRDTDQIPRIEIEKPEEEKLAQED